jgi:hypothetical protein
MSKLGISKTELLSDPKIKLLYQQYMKQQGKGKKMKGAGLFDSFVQFLKDSKILSNVSGVLLPVAGATLGGILGTTLSPAGTALGTATGTAIGKSGSDYIKSLGFGLKKMRGGDSRLVINPQGTRLGQRGPKKLKGGCGCGMMKGGAMTYSTTGVYSHVPGTKSGTQYGSGMTAFNSVASQFGKVKF